MTPEGQNIAIAEACGWKHQEGEEIRYGGTTKTPGWFRPDGKFSKGRLGQKEAGLPDFLHDLNAIYEAILAVIDPSYIELFHQHLYDVLERDWTPARWHMFGKPCQFYAFAMATAAQRSEAFLKCLGKWKDTP